MPDRRPALLAADGRWRRGERCRRRPADLTIPCSAPPSCGAAGWRRPRQPGARPADAVRTAARSSWSPPPPTWPCWRRSGSLGRADELTRLAAEQARGAGWTAGPQLACAHLATALSAYHRDDLPRLGRPRPHDPGRPPRPPVRLAAAVLGAWCPPVGRGRPARPDRLDGAERATAAGRPAAGGRGQAARAKLLAATATSRRRGHARPGDGGGRRSRRWCWPGPARQGDPRPPSVPGPVLPPSRGSPRPSLRW